MDGSKAPKLTQELESVVKDPTRFYEQLTEVLSLLSNPSLDFEEWFDLQFKPLIVLNNHNFFAAHLAIKKMAHQPNKQLFPLLRVLEAIDQMAQNNEDTRFLSSSVRFAQNSTLPSDLVTPITNIIRSSGNIAGGDIVKLFKVYNSESPPDVFILRSHDIMDPFLRETFLPNHPKSYMDKKLWLIAYAAFWNSSSNSKSHVENGVALLTELSELLERMISMANLQDHLQLLLNYIKEPVCATAILLWLKVKLFQDDFYEWTSFSQGETPAAFHVLDEVAINLPSHRSRALDIWISLFEREFSTLESKSLSTVVMQFRERFLQHFVLLFHNGFERPVLKYFGSKIDSIDPTLMIFFLNNIVPDIEMPIMPEIYGLMIKMLKNAPGQSMTSSQAVSRLLASGNHIALSQADSELHQELESKLI